jgi:hypothetical protein
MIEMILQPHPENRTNCSSGMKQLAYSGCLTRESETKCVSLCTTRFLARENQRAEGPCGPEVYAEHWSGEQK